MKYTFSVLLLAGSMLLTVSCSKAPADAQAAGSASGAAATQPASASNLAPTDPAANSAAPQNGNPATANYAQQDAVANYQPLQIPSGTSLSVRLQTPVSSATAQPGDRFRAVLNSPLRVHGQTVAPSGSEVVGKVVAAERSGRLEHPGLLSLELDSIHIDGRNVAIRTSRVTAQGASHKKRNLAWIGGGAGGGALLGGLMGGGKGAAIGGLAGAGAGTATAAATGKHDVAFNAEHALSFQLRQSVVVQ